MLYTLSDRAKSATSLALICIPGALLVILAIVSFIHDPSKTHDLGAERQRADTSHKFGPAGTAESFIRSYYPDQVAALGVPASDHDIAKTCYKNQPIGGGPGAPDKPVLWCGVSLTKVFTVPANPEQVGSLIDRLRPLAHKAGMTSNDDHDSSLSRVPLNSGGTPIEYGASSGDDENPDGYGCVVQAWSDDVARDTKGNYTFEDYLGSAYDTSHGAQVSIRYEFKCDGQAAYVPTGYIYLK